MINRIVIEMLGNNSTGNCYFYSGGRVAYEGSVDTDLAGGSYMIRPDKKHKTWIIDGATGNLRFYVVLDGADPWALSYMPRFPLEVTSVRDPVSPDEEPVNGIGPDAYSDDPKYIDNVVKGHYDVLTGEFTVEFADGSEVYLPYMALLADFTEEKRTDPTKLTSRDAMMYVYYQNQRNGKIYPRIFDKRTCPNLYEMVMETEAARPDAEAMVRIGRVMLEIAKLRASVQPLIGGPMAGLRYKTAPWKATPKGFPPAVRPLVGITGNPPMARVGQMGANDCLLSAVQQTSKGTVYRVDAIAATGAEAATVRAAHRQMLLAAAQQARANGQSTFTLVGKQANQNFRAHADALARKVGVPNSGTEMGGMPPLKDYGVTLSVEKVIGSNTAF
jgi:hypothetical protein